MRLFGSRRVVAYEVIFVPGGQLHTYEKSPEEFAELSDLPHGVWAVYQDGSRARVDLRIPIGLNRPNLHPA